MQHNTTLYFSNGSVTLNEEQYSVVKSPTNQNLRILASAGSGKTTTITARIAHLIENECIPANRILLVTFSRAASQEMIERVYRLIGRVPILAGTFHAISAQVLRENAPSMLRDHPFIDELPHRLVQWLETDKGRKWVLQFRTIIVDEFQDINNVQWRLLEKMHHRGATMTIVGDDAQNIYTWRGSSVDFILNFHTRMHNIADYQLRRNYRSSEAVVTVANSVMRFIPTLPYKEKMVAVKKGGIKPQVHFFFRMMDEYDWVVKQIEEEYRKQTPTTFAILSRCNHDLFKLEERLHQRGLLYTLCTKFDPERSHHHSRRITLATIHASKGLEWDYVFMINMNDDSFPSRKTDEEIICERRLFYVGVTRARHRLFFTYSRQERSLSRFVREIPRPFLTYFNVSAFQLSDKEGTTSKLSLQDCLTGLDGDDWHTLRKMESVPQIDTSIQTTDNLYSFGQLFVTPDWVKELDIREQWQSLLTLIAMRQVAHTTQNISQLRSPEVNETLLTLRIYKEDLLFWEEFEIEMETIVYHFLKHNPNMPPVEYHQMEEFLQKAHAMQHLSWTTEQIVRAVVIVAKLRGQLRPLRHDGYDLSDFSFGNVRCSVPTELRPYILKSWKNIQKIPAEIPSATIMRDIWNIASLSSVMIGRNIPLYQVEEILPYLQTDETTQLIYIIERAMEQFISAQDGVAINVHVHENGIKMFNIDLINNTTCWSFYFDHQHVPSNDARILLLLSTYLYEKSVEKEMQYVGFINLATGTVYKFIFTDELRKKTKKLWNYVRRKYVLGGE